MPDVEEIIERLGELSYEEALAHWTAGELEEAEFYRKLAERAGDLGLSESLVEAFIMLSEDSERHAVELREEFEASFGREPSAEIPPLEALPVLDRFERADQVKLETAMESELIAMNAYKALAEKVGDERLRELCLKLADVEKGLVVALKRGGWYDGRDSGGD